MAVRTKSEIMDILKTQFSGNTVDEVLTLLEDVSDTLDDLETKAKGDGEDWKTKFEKNDAEWRQRYQDRFFSGTSDGNGKQNNSNTDVIDKNDEVTDETDEPLRYEDLFTSPDGKE